jgi:hypothetical protein
MDAGGSGRDDVAVALDFTGLGLKTAAGTCCAMPCQEGERAKKEENRAMRGLASERACQIVHRCEAPPRCSIDASRATRTRYVKFSTVRAPARIIGERAMAGRRHCYNRGAQE